MFTIYSLKHSKGKYTYRYMHTEIMKKRTKLSFSFMFEGSVSFAVRVTNTCIKVTALHRCLGFKYEAE